MRERQGWLRRGQRGVYARRERAMRDARATGRAAGSAKGRLKSGAAAALMREASEADSGLPARGRSAECAREAQLLEVAAHWALACRGGQEGGPFQRIGTYVHTRKKIRWISTPALYGILVSVRVCVYACLVDVCVRLRALA